ncbi:MAG: thioredoxin family protein [Anaerolineaceae bacterium]|nr:thioredoxin family protein [Anaerolineaceae bacterium]
MINDQVWNTGLLLNDYIIKMDTYQKEMLQRINDIRITSAEFQRLKTLEKKRNILVLTESGCRDSLMNLPILAKIVEAAPCINLKLFTRSENRELTEFFALKGIHNIPVFWVMNDDFSYCGHWVERPKPAYRKIEEWKKENPEYDLIKSDMNISEAERVILIKPWSEKLLDEMWNWYDTELQSDTIIEIQNILLS